MSRAAAPRVQHAHSVWRCSLPRSRRRRCCCRRCCCWRCSGSSSRSCCSTAACSSCVLRRSTRVAAHGVSCGGGRRCCSSNDRSRRPQVARRALRGRCVCRREFGKAALEPCCSRCCCSLCPRCCPPRREGLGSPSAVCSRRPCSRERRPPRRPERPRPRLERLRRGQGARPCHVRVRRAVLVVRHAVALRRRSIDAHAPHAAVNGREAWRYVAVTQAPKTRVHRPHELLAARLLGGGDEGGVAAPQLTVCVAQARRQLGDDARAVLRHCSTQRSRGGDAASSVRAAQRHSKRVPSGGGSCL